MTKAKAQALGLLSSPGALVWCEGDVVPTLPDLHNELEGTSIGEAAFAEWLRGPLARYRVSAKARAAMGQQSTVIAWLAAAENDIPAAVADGRLRHVPAFFAEPAVSHAAVKAGTTWRQALASGDLELIARLVREGRESLQRQRPRRGRPSAHERDLLLAAIVERLRAAGLGAAEAQHRADLILVACSVPSPEASVPRAARRARR